MCGCSWCLKHTRLDHSSCRQPHRADGDVQGTLAASQIWSHLKP